MMKTTEEAIVRIPILRYDERQNLDFNAWKKSFAASMRQKYGELAQVYRTREAFEYDIPVRPAVSGDYQRSLSLRRLRSRFELLRLLCDNRIVSNGSTDTCNSTQSSISHHRIMMKTTEEAIVRIPILRYYGRQNLDFNATSMGQKYGELAQVYRTGEAFEYDIPVRPAVSGDKDIDAMERAMYMERMAEHHKAKAMQSATNNQLYSELHNKLHDDASKKLLDDPLWGEIKKKQDPKGLMTAVTKFMLLSSSGNLHQDTHRARMIYNALRQNEKESLQDYYHRTIVFNR